MSTAPPSKAIALTPKPLSQMKREDYIELARTDPERMAALVDALVRCNTAELPETVFVRRGENGFLRKITVTRRLSVASGHLDGGGVNAAGYRYLNEVAGLMVVTPHTVIVNNLAQPNPYIDIDEKTRQPKVVYARKICVGRNSSGSLCASDVMIRLDPQLYLLETMMKRVMKAGANAASFGVFGDVDDKPVAADGAMWKHYALSTVGLGLWLNVRSHGLGELLDAHTTRVKYLERIAQTMAERNALKAHPAMPAKVVINKQTGEALVRITGWTHEFEYADLEKIRRLSEENMLSSYDPTMEVNTKVIEGAVEDVDALDADATVIAAEKESLEEEARVAAGHADEDANLLNRAATLYADLLDSKGMKGVKERLERSGITTGTLEGATDEQLTKFLQGAKQ